MAINLTTITAEPFEFEKLLSKDVFGWMETNWTKSIYYSILYIIIIFSLKIFMKNRKALDLKKPLILWNLGFSIFSTAGSLRLIPRFLQAWQDHGFSYPTCDRNFSLESQSSVFWCWLFICSKPIEFGDTLFIILRKKKLVFLHWYHHTMTLIMCWYLTSNLASISYIFTMMNYFVHSFMYAYFAFSALNVKIPRLIAMVVTTLQISQMIAGLIISFWVFIRRQQGIPCDSPYDTVLLSIFVYLSYFILFSRLFYFNYVMKSKNVKYVKKE